MKKLWLLVALAVLTLGVVGCTTVMTYDDTGHEIDVSVGQEFIIALGANQTTGYSWQASYDETKLELVKSTYEVEETEEPAVGAGGIRYFRFKALEAGETEITLTYKQDWEGGEVGETKVFTVNID